LASIISLFRSHRGQKSLFQALLRPHIELMYRMAYRWTQSQADAEDLVQDILIRLANRVDEMQQIDNLRPWLIKVLYHRYVDLYRHRKSSPIEEDVPSWQADDDMLTSRIDNARDDQDLIHRLELQQTLLKALETLDDDQRDTVLLHDVEGYSALEVAEILEINVGTVKSRLHRARARLKIFLSAGTF
jgi:RNA polymerase sigma-70 factor (ECF subfamily)